MKNPKYRNQFRGLWEYMRECKRCGMIYYTIHRKGKICDNCKKKKHLYNSSIISIIGGIK